MPLDSIASTGKRNAVSQIFIPTHEKVAARRIVAHHRAAGTNPDTASELILVLDSYVALTFTPPNDNVSSTAISFIVRKYHLLPTVLAAILHIRDVWHGNSTALERGGSFDVRHNRSAGQCCFASRAEEPITARALPSPPRRTLVLRDANCP